MYDTEVWKAMVERRVTGLRRKRKMQMTAILTVLCLVITVSLAKVTGILARGGQGHVPGLYGSTMLSEDAGGYVLVSVLTFSLGVVITVLCIRYRERKNTRKKNKSPPTY